MSALILKTLSIYGLAAVVSMLIAAVIKVVVVLLNMLERKPAAISEARASSAPAAIGSDLTADHVVAIAAAVYAAIGAHHIVHIDDVHGGGQWSAEGRVAHHTSHAVPTHTPKR